MKEGRIKLQKPLVQKPIAQVRSSFSRFASVAFLTAFALSSAMGGQDANYHKKKTDALKPVAKVEAPVLHKVPKHKSAKVAKEQITFSKTDYEKHIDQHSKLSKMFESVGVLIGPTSAHADERKSISIKQLDEWKAKEKELKILNDEGIHPELGYNMYIFKVQVPGQNWILTAQVVMGKDPGNNNVDTNAVRILTIDKKTNKGTGVRIELDALSEAYLKLSGKKMEYVKVFGTSGIHENAGYIDIAIVPVDKPNSAPKPGVPVMGVTYLDGKSEVYSSGEDSASLFVLSSR